ncbi:MAG: hypothetical protein HQ521_11840 [Bacteroidetes bacterium]|nr:hypothetical protein [Bacteroidota bacterium]
MMSINENDIQGIIEKYGNEETVHVHKDSIDWPGDHELKNETIGSERSSKYRNDLMKKIDLLFEEIRSLTKFEDVINNQRIDLLEVARYDFFFPLSYLVYPIWVLEQIIEEHSPETILWVSSDQTTSIPKRRFKEYLEKIGITLINWPRQKLTATDHPSDGKLLFWRIALGDIKNSLLEAFHCSLEKPYLQLTKEFGETDILFIENFPNSAKISASVARELENEKDISYCFTTTNLAVLNVVSFLNKTLLIKNVLRPMDWINIAYKQFRVSWLAFVIFKRLKSGQFINWREFSPLIDPRVRFTIAKTLRRATEMIITSAVLIKTLHPKVVATTSNSSSLSRASAALGNKQGVTTFLLQHGCGTFYNFEHYVLQNKILVWGKKYQEPLLKQRFNLENVIITGSPKFGNAKVLKDFSSSHSHKQKGHPRKIAYFPSLSDGSSISKEKSISALELVLDAFSNMKDVLLTIKTKSDDKYTIFNKNIINNNIEIKNDISAIELIEQSDIIIVTTSTVGLEACVIGKPVIVLNLNGLDIFSFYEEYGCALLAATDRELQDALKKIRDKDILFQLGKGRRLLIDNVFNGCKPGAIKRIAVALLDSIYDR